MADRPASIPAFADLPNARYEIPAGDSRLRAVCNTCDFISYVNPTFVVGVLAAFVEREMLHRLHIIHGEVPEIIPALVPFRLRFDFSRA